MPESITVSQFSDWQSLRAFDQNGDDVISGEKETTALVNALRGGENPLSAEQAQAAVAKLHLKDAAVTQTLVKALTSVNAFAFDLTLRHDPVANWMTVADSHGSTIVDLSDRAPVDGTADSVPTTVVDPKTATGVAASTKTTKDLPLGGVVTEDGTFAATAIEMGFADAASLPYIQSMAAIGEREGFDLVINVTPSAQANLQKALAETIDPAYLTRIRLVTSDRATVWVQDSGEWRNGGKTVVAPVDIGDERFIQTAIMNARSARGMYGQVYQNGQLDDVTVVGKQGAVAAGNLTQVKAAAASILGAEMVQGQSYLEGGNVQTGVRANGETYALVGRDSVALTRAYLEKAQGRSVSEADIVALMAQDIGVKPENLYVVEQPGAFHLDMGMMLTGGDGILMNDAMAAFDHQVAWLRADYEAMKPAADSPEFASWQALGGKLDREIVRMKARAELQAKWEAQSQADLEKAGFTVTRVAGSYRDVSIPSPDGRLRLASPAMNFLNVQRLRNAQGENVAIGLGGTPRAQALFQQQVLTGKPGGLDRIYFLNETVTPITLRAQGGINCRTKLMTGVVTVPPTPQSHSGAVSPGVVDLPKAQGVSGRLATVD